jgi:hypothetical protein
MLPSYGIRKYPGDFNGTFTGGQVSGGGENRHMGDL